MLLPDIAIIAIAIATLLCLGLLIKELFSKKEKVQQLEDVELKSTHDKALASLLEAHKKAAEVLNQAERTGIKVVESSNMVTGKLEADYELHLNQALDLAVTNATTLMNQKLNTLFDNFEAKLTAMLQDTQQRSVSAIDLELKAARNLIETYKAQQLQIVDENIVAMLEKTLSLVLTKKLTLQDQVELVEEALERAKTEKVII